MDNLPFSPADYIVPPPPAAWLETITAKDREPIVFGMGPFTSGFCDLVTSSLARSIESMEKDMPPDDRGLIHWNTQRVTVSDRVELIYISIGFGCIPPPKGIEKEMDILLRSLTEGLVETMAIYDETDPDVDARFHWLEKAIARQKEAH